jgi:hypothetical protein
LNARFRTAARHRAHFPTEQSALKVLYLVAIERRQDRANPTGQITEVSAPGGCGHYIACSADSSPGGLNGPSDPLPPKATEKPVVISACGGPAFGTGIGRDDAMTASIGCAGGTMLQSAPTCGGGSVSAGLSLDGFSVAVGSPGGCTPGVAYASSGDDEGGGGGSGGGRKSKRAAGEARAALAKFIDYLFKEGATHGKATIFASLDLSGDCGGRVPVVCLD